MTILKVIAAIILVLFVIYWVRYIAERLITNSIDKQHREILYDNPKRGVAASGQKRTSSYDIEELEKIL